jgi:enoyl-CoA hydratase
MESLALEVQEAVATVTLVGPGKGNALGPAFWRELPELFARLDGDPAVRAVVVKGSGKAFTYGLDLMAMAGELGPLLLPGGGASERTALLAMIRKLQGAIDAVARCTKPVIAAVHGWCIGGGLDLASACDLRLCSADARFSLREVKVGMVADIGSLQRLPAIIGEGHTRELAFTGCDVEATRAKGMGLVNAVHETPEALFEAADRLAREIAQNPPLVVSGIKQVLNAEAEGRAQRGLAYVAAWNAAFLPSEDLQEAFAAFAERRAPQFKGR